jgi:hypothetical protein
VGEVLRQQRDVIPSIPQWSDLDGEDVQAVVEVLAEAAGVDLLLQVSPTSRPCAGRREPR